LVLEKHVFEITRRVLQNTFRELLPGPEVQGEPFWALMSVDSDGEVNGSFYATWQDGKRIVPLFTSKDQAEHFLNLSGEGELMVRGIRKNHLRVLLEFQKRGRIQLGICMPKAESPGGYGCYIPMAEHITQILHELGYSLNES